MEPSRSHPRRRKGIWPHRVRSGLWSVLLTVAALAVGSCVVRSEPPGTAAPTAPPSVSTTGSPTTRPGTSGTLPTTTISSSTTTTAPPAGEPPDTGSTVPADSTAPPDHYRFGDDGLWRVVDGVETELLDGPVTFAWDDRMGGSIAGNDTSDLFHFGAGATTPTRLLLDEPGDDSYGYARFTGVVDGRPVLFFAGIPKGADRDTWPCSDWSLNSRDLITGEDRFHLCLPAEDAGLRIRSFAAGLFVGAPLGMCNATSTSTSLDFWDVDGNPVDIPANPFPPEASCAPCELSALLSADGSLLAYRFRPDSFWHESPYYSGDPCDGNPEQYDRWWEESRKVTAVIAVIDLDTGDTVWTLETGADSDLADFDGRYVVVTTGTGTTIYDIGHERPPHAVGANVVLARPPVPNR